MANVKTLNVSPNSSTKNENLTDYHLTWNAKSSKWDSSHCEHGIESNECKDPECVARYIHDE